jgi:2-oxoglutarate ferredoxin oxidoreductase subunit gamma
MARTEIRITGFGGQGVILAAYIIGKAAAVVEGRHATLNQSFGPEARGSACSAQLIVSDDPVTFPYVRGTDILVAMSQDAFRRFVGEVRDGGLVLVDDSLVTCPPEPRLRALGAPATRTAEKLGRRIVSNMVMVGLFAATTGVVSVKAAREAVRTSVPPGTEELNLAAFDSGAEMGQALVAPQHLEEVQA